MFLKQQSQHKRKKMGFEGCRYENRDREHQRLIIIYNLITRVVHILQTRKISVMASVKMTYELNFHFGIIPQKI